MPHPRELRFVGHGASRSRSFFGLEEDGNHFRVVWMLEEMEEKVRPDRRDGVGGHRIVFVILVAELRRGEGWARPYVDDVAWEHLKQWLHVSGGDVRKTCRAFLACTKSMARGRRNPGQSSLPRIFL
jgi:hypothetical protein